MMIFKRARPTLNNNKNTKVYADVELTNINCQQATVSTYVWMSQNVWVVVRMYGRRRILQHCLEFHLSSRSDFLFFSALKATAWVSMY